MTATARAVVVQPVDTGRTQKVPPKQRPWPLTGGHPLRSLHNKVQTIATSAIFGGHGLAFAFIGLYYLLFSTIPAVHYDWNHLLSTIVPVLSQDHWNTWRHLFRDDGESFMATLGIAFFLYNPYAKSVKKLTSPWQIIVRVLLAIAVLVPVLIAGNLAITALTHSLHSGLLTNVGTAHPNFAQKIYTDGNVASKIFTIIAGMIASKFVMPPVYDYTLRHFAQRKVARGKKTHFYHAPAYRALVNELYSVEGAQARAASNEDAQGNALNRFMLIAGLVTVALAGLGIYVTAYIA